MEPNQAEIEAIFALFNGDVESWLRMERALTDDADRGITRLDVDLTLDDLRKRLGVPPLRNVPLPLRALRNYIAGVHAPGEKYVVTGYSKVLTMVCEQYGREDLREIFEVAQLNAALADTPRAATSTITGRTSGARPNLQGIPRK